MTNSTKSTGATRVAVTIIRCREKMLLIYNSKWRAFSFPMTKLRPWEILDPSQILDADQRDIVLAQQKNHWTDAAAHAAVECLGKPSCPKPLLDGTIEVEYSEVDRSQRDGADRIYHYKPFTLEVAEEFESLHKPFAWLTAEEIRAGQHRPISPTVLKILTDQEVSDIVKEWLR